MGILVTFVPPKVTARRGMSDMPTRGTAVTAKRSAPQRQRANAENTSLQKSSNGVRKGLRARWPTPLRAPFFMGPFAKVRAGGTPAMIPPARATANEKDDTHEGHRNPRRKSRRGGQAGAGGIYLAGYLLSHFLRAAAVLGDRESMLVYEQVLQGEGEEQEKNRGGAGEHPGAYQKHRERAEIFINRKPSKRPQAQLSLHLRPF